MKKQPTTTNENRKMKFAEAGVLFVLVLAITIFVGVRMSSHLGQDDTMEVAEVVAEAPMEIESPINSSADIIETPQADETAEVAVEILAPEGSDTLEATPPRIVTYVMAEQAYFDGSYEEAAEMFDTYTAEHSANAWGYYMLGLSELKAGDLDASEEAFITALDIKPDHVKSLVNYGRVLLAQERPIEARVQIELALQSAPQNVSANRMFSRIAHNEGLLDEAADGYLKVLQIQEDDVWSLNNLGLIRIEQERFDEALAPLAKAAQLSTEVACIQNNLGVALERTGHYTAATTAFELALAADGNYTKADVSLERVSGLSEAIDLAPVDLIALAAGFSALPTIVTIEPEVMDVASDMEVATSLIISEAPQAPQDR